MSVPEKYEVSAETALACILDYVGKTIPRVSAAGVYARFSPENPCLTPEERNTAWRVAQRFFGKQMSRRADMNMARDLKASADSMRASVAREGRNCFAVEVAEMASYGLARRALDGRVVGLADAAERADLLACFLVFAESPPLAIAAAHAIWRGVGRDRPSKPKSSKPAKRPIASHRGQRAFRSRRTANAEATL